MKLVGREATGWAWGNGGGGKLVGREITGGAFLNGKWKIESKKLFKHQPRQLERSQPFERM